MKIVHAGFEGVIAFKFFISNFRWAKQLPFNRHFLIDDLNVRDLFVLYHGIVLNFSVEFCIKISFAFFFVDVTLQWWSKLSEIMNPNG